MDRNVLLEMVLEPGTGKALEVKAGQILRIEQVEGLQCVDFNCFNLHDYKEFMHCVMRTSNFALKPIKLTLFEATEAEMAAAPKTPILKSQRTPKDFRNPTIKTKRQLTRDSSYVAEFVNTPIKLADVAIELLDEEAAMLDRLRLPVYGADDGAALRDILFTWWEQKFLGAAESGAPAIGDRKA
jgi:Domain of unknown function (DUF1989)